VLHGYHRAGLGPGVRSFWRSVHSSGVRTEASGLGRWRRSSDRCPAVPSLGGWRPARAISPCRLNENVPVWLCLRQQPSSTAANTQAGTFSNGQATARIAVATSASRAAGWSAPQTHGGPDGDYRGIGEPRIPSSASPSNGGLMGDGRRETWRSMAASGVRRDKAALSSGCKPHPATAPAGSNRSRHGGDEMSEAFG
jgi:hypothetical protein